jgi:ribokinase
LSNKDIKQIGLNHDCVFLDTKKKLGSWVDSIKFIKINELEYEKNKDFIVTNEIKNKVIITLGSNGANYKSAQYTVPKVGIRDVAGAGDSFIAGLTTKYIQTRDIIKAIKFANQCATKVIQKRGVSTI